MSDLLDALRAAGVGRGRAGRLGRVDEAADDEMWRVREQGRERLVQFVRQRLRDQLWPGACRASDVAWCDALLDPEALTIGFARRFATYKRANLLLSQPERLQALLLSADRPGAVRLRRQGPPGRRRRQGDDPPDRRLRGRPRRPAPVRVPRGLRHRRRPAALPRRRRVAEQPAPPARGVRHERHEGRAQRRAQLLDPRRLVGRVLRRRERLGHRSAEDDRRTSSDRDEIEANSLFGLLERQIVPLFYDRGGPVPRRWMRPDQAQPASRSARS